MALKLSKSEINSGSAMQAYHFTQSIDALTGAVAYDVFVSGSVTLTSSMQVSGLNNTPNTNVISYNPTTGLISTTASLDVTVGNADSASYFDLNAGTDVIVNKVGTAYYVSLSADILADVDFGSFTSSFRNNTFTGSFTGSLIGTASYVDLRAGSEVTINKTGTTYYLSSSAIAGGLDQATLNAFNVSGRTGSFTGSFTGSLLGTASHVDFSNGTNITISKVGNSFQITQLNAAPSLSNILTTASLATSQSIQFSKSGGATFTIPIAQTGSATSSKYLYENYGDDYMDIPEQLPGGNVRVFVNVGNLTTKTFYLPTSSIKVGDTIDIFFGQQSTFVP